MDWVIFGLGNVGLKYRNTRHNIGFMVLDRIAKECGAQFTDERKLSGKLTKVHHNDHIVALIKPTTFMNGSGECVKKVLDYYKVPPTKIVVIYDDTALPFTSMRVREKGSSGGHNGLKSIEQHLQSQDYIRLRMGIGEKHGFAELSDYVLAPFTDAEQAVLPPFIDLGAKTALRITLEPLAQVMNGVNQQVKEKQNGKQSKSPL